MKVNSCVFKCSCYTHILFYCEKNSPMRKTQVASLEQVYEYVFEGARSNFSGTSTLKTL